MFRELVELADSVKDKINVNENELNEWVNVDNDEPVTFTLGTDDIINHVMNRQSDPVQDEESDDEIVVAKKVSWSLAAESFDNLILFYQQHSVYTMQESLQLHIMHSKFLQSRRRACKQQDIRALFNKAIGRQSITPEPSVATINNISSDVFPGPCSAPPPSSSGSEFNEMTPATPDTIEVPTTPPSPQAGPSGVACNLLHRYHSESEDDPMSSGVDSDLE